MFKRKCPGCGKKIDKNFNYCPYCGIGFKEQNEIDNFGMLGRDDSMFNDDFAQGSEIKIPFGLDKIMNRLIKEMEKQMNSSDKSKGIPRGIKIQISSGMPFVEKVPGNEKQEVQRKKEIVRIPKEEIERRNKLPKVEAESHIRRLGDKVIYEISIPGVKSGRDIMITKLEQGIEIKAYSKDKCYVKTIPLRVEVLRYSLKEDTLFVEFRG